MILQDYKRASGQLINLSKSNIFFGHNTSTVVRNSIATTLHINNLEALDKFLGLPSEIPRSKRQILSIFKDCIASKTTS